MQTDEPQLQSDITEQLQAQRAGIKIALTVTLFVSAML